MIPYLQGIIFLLETLVGCKSITVYAEEPQTITRQKIL